MPKLATLAPDAKIDDVRTAVMDGARTLLELRSTPADKRGDTWNVDVREAADYIHDLNLVHATMEADERAARQADEDARNKSRGSRSFSVGDESEHRSLGHQITEGDAFEEFARRNGKEVEVRNLIGGYTAGAYDSGSDGWLPVGSPQLAVGSIQRRRIYLRDIMSVQGTGLKVIPYVREINQVTNETGAAMTSEGSAKAEVTAQFENYNAVVEKITAWLPITEEIVTDAPTLRGYIDTRLTYMLDIREEAQVLAGSGTSPNLLGLDNVTPQTQGAVSGDLPATVGQAIGKVENYDGEANGCVLNPLDYWTAVTKRYSTQFDNGFSAGAPSSSESNITWGIPAVRTRGVASGVGYVGDWRMGATLFDRQQTSVKIADQHSDYATRGILAVIAGRRVAVAWHRPSLFVKATVPTS